MEIFLCLVIICMDECGVNIKMSRRKDGHSGIGEADVEFTKDLDDRNFTLNLLIGIDGTVFGTVTLGASNSDTYIGYFHEAKNAYTEDGKAVLLPGNVVIVDNCPFHHNRAETILRDYFADYNIGYTFTPRYSPDMNPVEACFMKVKTVLKNSYFQHLLTNNPQVAILEAVDSITNNDIYSFYKGVTGNYMGLQ